MKALQNDFLKNEVVLMWLPEYISSSCTVEPRYNQGARDWQIIMFAAPGGLFISMYSFTELYFAIASTCVTNIMLYGGHHVLLGLL